MYVHTPTISNTRERGIRKVYISGKLQSTREAAIFTSAFICFLYDKNSISRTFMRALQVNYNSLDNYTFKSARTRAGNNFAPIISPPPTRTRSLLLHYMARARAAALLHRGRRQRARMWHNNCTILQRHNLCLTASGIYPSEIGTERRARLRFIHGKSTRFRKQQRDTRGAMRVRIYIYNTHLFFTLSQKIEQSRHIGYTYISECGKTREPSFN